MELKNVLRRNVKTKESDVDERQLCKELGVLAPIPNNTITSVGFFVYVVRNVLFLNVPITLPIMLTLPITVARGEQCFLKLKNLKNYLHS